jgi:NADH:ubiquinone oxidoreductase subunit 6 (subunit J)
MAFYATAAVAVASAFMVIWHKNPVINALYLVLCFFAVAVAYVLLQAHFLAAIQVLLYAGAVLVLFLMMIMLLNLDKKALGPASPTVGKFLGVAMAFGIVLIAAATMIGFKWLNKPYQATKEELAQFLIQMGEDRARLMGAAPPDRFDPALTEQRPLLNPEEMAEVARDALISYEHPETRARTELPERFLRLGAGLEDLRKLLMGELYTKKDVFSIEAPVGYSEFSREDIQEYLKAVARGRLRYLQEFGTTASVGRVLFSRYILPFEAAGVLLLAAIVGVMVLARRGPGEGEA